MFSMTRERPPPPGRILYKVRLIQWGGGGRLLQEFQLPAYPFMYHFDRKGTPFAYLLLKQGTPFVSLILRRPRSFGASSLPLSPEDDMGGEEAAHDLGRLRIRLPFRIPFI